MPPRARALLVLLATAACVIGCSSDDVIEVPPCGPNVPCPTGFTCTATGVCVAATVFDARLPDGPGAVADAKVVDASIVDARSFDAQVADARPPDASSPDASPPDAPPPPDAPVTVGALTVIVYASAGVPAVDVDVLVHDESGAVVDTGVTGADGRFTEPQFHDGGMLTVAQRKADATPASLVTAMNLRHGMSLTVGVSDKPGVTLDATTVRFARGFADAVTYSADDGCGFATKAGESVTVTTTTLCGDGAGVHRFVGYAVDDSGQRLAYGVDDVVLPGTGLIPDWKTDLATVVVKPTQLYAGDWTYVALFSGRLEATPRARPHAVAGTFTSPVTQTLRYARGAYDMGVFTLAVANPDGSVTSLLERRRLLPDADADDYDEAVAVTDDLLVPPASATVSRADPARPSLDFSPSAVPLDGVFLSLFVHGGTAPFQWRIVAAPDAPRPLALPALSDALADFRPTAGDLDVPPTAMVIDTDFRDGYDAWVTSVNLLDPVDAHPPFAGAVSRWAATNIVN